MYASVDCATVLGAYAQALCIHEQLTGEDAAAAAAYADGLASTGFSGGFGAAAAAGGSRSMFGLPEPGAVSLSSLASSPLVLYGGLAAAAGIGLYFWRKR